MTFYLLERWGFKLNHDFINTLIHLNSNELMIYRFNV